MSRDFSLLIFRFHKNIYTLNVLTARLLLLFELSEASTAVYRSVSAGLERNFSFLAALSASGGEHLSCCFACILSCCTAFLASLGFVLESLLCVEFLFSCGENEFFTAIFANQGLVFVHVCNLSRKIFFIPAGLYRHLIAALYLSYKGHIINKKTPSAE